MHAPLLDGIRKIAMNPKDLVPEAFKKDPLLYGAAGGGGAMLGAGLLRRISKFKMNPLFAGLLAAGAITGSGFWAKKKRR